MSDFLFGGDIEKFDVRLHPSSRGGSHRLVCERRHGMVRSLQSLLRQELLCQYWQPRHLQELLPSFQAFPLLL